MGFKRRAPVQQSRRGKPKRSKRYWQQRPTFAVPTHEQERGDRRDERESSESEREEEEEEPCGYQRLLSVFGDAERADNAASSSDEDSDDQEDEGEEEEEEGEEERPLEEKKESDDSVEEEEEEEEVEVEEEEEEKEEEKVSSLDPFLCRYELEIPPSIVEPLESNRFEKSETFFRGPLGRVESRIVAVEDASKGGEKKTLEDDGEAEERTEIRKGQSAMTTTSKPDPFTSLAEMGVTPRLRRRADEVISGNAFSESFFSLLNSYKDVYYPERDSENADDIRRSYVLHALNHALKSRTNVVKNDEKKAGAPRDQGLCRPKVLVLVPFRESCRKFVHEAISFMFEPDQVAKNVMNKTRFDSDFSSDAPDKKDKPDDYYETFAGNIDDSFKLGIAVTKKSLKLYADFYSSDIVIASPLGLRIVLGEEGDSERDFDFLTSVEMFISDQTDVFTMQNWEHVHLAASHLHKKPVKSHGVDFCRVRLWALNGLSRFYRQSIVVSGVGAPEINSLFNKNCHNYMGRLKIQNPVLSGSICGVTADVPMTFRRFESANLLQSPDNRFDFFAEKILPDFAVDSAFRTLVFIPSYFDFVHVRTHFDKVGYDFGEICEYTEDKKIAAARDNFFHNELHFILYTERSHFYRRFKIKGIRHLIFYQLPLYSHFYSELVNFMLLQNRKAGGGGNMSVTVLYDKFDGQRVASVAGSERAAKMMSSAKKTHLFVADGK